MSVEGVGDPIRQRGYRPATLAITAGRPARSPDGPLSEPVTFASTFHAGGPVAYGRDGNATWTALEVAIGTLEGGPCVSFSSGMAAISAVFDLVPLGGTVVVPTDAYMLAIRLAKERWDAGRIGAVREVDLTDTRAVIEAAQGADLVWLESPTNPLLDVADLAACCPGASAGGGLVAVDNTFATPLGQQPLALGADLSVHSVTKMLAGHSDVVLGAVAARSDELCARIRALRSLHGAVPGPMEAWLALRGMRTLALRWERSCASAAVLAARLAAHPAVGRVRFPGFGATVSFEVAGADRAETVSASCRLLIHATSLGGIETTIERRARWPSQTAPPGLLRMSVGCEDVEDLWADLDRALRIAIR